MRVRDLAYVVAMAFCVAPPAQVAYAHETGHESRTPAQCERLPGTATGGERGNCLKCVARPVKHHYHPDYPAGNRCRPDNGKP